MSNKYTKTKEFEEKDKGRIALWLDTKDIQYLAKHCCCSEDTSQDEKDRCSRIRFRANAALHKANLKE